MLVSQYGGLAQLARAPALQAGGHRFDSDILHTPERPARTTGGRSKTIALWRIAQQSDAERGSKEGSLAIRSENRKVALRKFF
jgi:hypothetical protein